MQHNKYLTNLIANDCSSKLGSALARTRFPTPTESVLMYLANALCVIRVWAEADVCRRPMRGGEAIKTHLKDSNFQRNIII